MYDISPVYARFVLRELLERGVESSMLFQGTTLDRDTLELGGNISKDNFVRFLNNARTVSGDEKLGLLIGQHTNVVSLGPIGAAVATAPTIREGLQVLENFARLHASYLQVDLFSSISGLSVQLRFLDSASNTERFHAEAAAMLVQHYVEAVSGKTLDDAEYCFAFPAPDYVEDYRDKLHGRVSFDHSLTSIELSPAWPGIRSPYFNAEIWSQAQQQLAQRLRALGEKSPDTYTDHVRALLRSCEPPLPDLGTVAARFHVSDRTLNRRLQREGNSFRQLKSTVLDDWARQYLLQTSASVEAIAASLGYQDAANFRRAFKARECCTPGQFRQRGLHAAQWVPPDS